MPAWNKEKIKQLADESKKPLEKEVVERALVESTFIASLMTKAELEKVLSDNEAASASPATDQPRSLYPAPKFNIGDIVRLEDSDDPDEVAVVVGIRLRYYSHMRQHVWYYETGDRMGCPTVRNHWLNAEYLEEAEVKTDNQKWCVTGVETPNVPMLECWECGQVRIDDNMDCPYCSADRIPNDALEE